MSLETKIKGSVKSENAFKESIRIEELLRLNWSINWQWYVDLLRERQKVIADYKKCSPRALAMGVMEKPDSRSVLPFPETTSQNYGWLATKNEFQLEIFGKYYDNSKQQSTRKASKTSDVSSSTFNGSSDV